MSTWPATIKTVSIVTAAIALILCVQYFIAEYVTSRGWEVEPYSYAQNDISDLGVPECYIGGSGDIARTVCSPLYGIMNASFLLQALLVMIALRCLWGTIPKNKRKMTAVFAIMFIVGISLVGLFPGALGQMLGGNIIRGTLHTIGAVLAIVGGNTLALYVGFMALRPARLYGIMSLTLGSIGLIGAVLLGLGIHMGLGPGGMERAAVNPIVVWFVMTGIWLLVRRERKTV